MVHLSTLELRKLRFDSREALLMEVSVKYLNSTVDSVRTYVSREGVAD